MAMVCNRAASEGAAVVIGGEGGRIPARGVATTVGVAIVGAGTERKDKNFATVGASHSLVVSASCNKALDCDPLLGVIPNEASPQTDEVYGRLRNILVDSR